MSIDFTNIFGFISNIIILISIVTMLRSRHRLAKLGLLLLAGILYSITNSIFYNLNHRFSKIYSENGNNPIPPVTSFPRKPSWPKLQNDTKQNTVKKYILMMTRNTPLNRLLEGQKTFILNKCDYQNCFLTPNISYLKSIKDFHAVLFGSPYPQTDIIQPKRRYKGQKYIFASTESAAYCQAMDSAHDDFYSWTWTYRLDSDILWRHFRVYDKKRNIVGPAKNIKWLKKTKMKSTQYDIKEKLKNKSKAAVWFASTCKTLTRREDFVSNLIPELEKYGWAIDIFGACGNDSCRNPSSCHKMLEDNYFFYLSFENSFEEDFVTEKILDAFNNLIVPIVYGGADYSRFLPPGSYLNARKHGPKYLAQIMNGILKNMTRYQDFFKWKNHYTFEPSLQAETCNLCAAMNDKNLVRKETKIKNFRSWWNGAKTQMVYDFLSMVVPIDNVLSVLTKNYNFSHEYAKVWFEVFKKRINVPSYVHFLNQNVEESIKERDEHDDGIRSVLQLSTTNNHDSRETETDSVSVSETVEVLVEDD